MIEHFLHSQVEESLDDITDWLDDLAGRKTVIGKYIRVIDWEWHYIHGSRYDGGFAAIARVEVQPYED